MRLIPLEAFEKDPIPAVQVEFLHGFTVVVHRILGPFEPAKSRLGRNRSQVYFHPLVRRSTQDDQAMLELPVNDVGTTAADLQIRDLHRTR